MWISLKKACESKYITSNRFHSVNNFFLKKNCFMEEGSVLSIISPSFVSIPLLLGRAFRELDWWCEQIQHAQQTNLAGPTHSPRNPTHLAPCCLSCIVTNSTTTSSITWIFIFVKSFFLNIYKKNLVQTKIGNHNQRGWKGFKLLKHIIFKFMCIKKNTIDNGPYPCCLTILERLISSCIWVKEHSKFFLLKKENRQKEKVLK